MEPIIVVAPGGRLSTELVAPAVPVAFVDIPDNELAVTEAVGGISVIVKGFLTC